MLPGKHYAYLFIHPRSLNVTVNVSTSNEAISLCFLFYSHTTTPPAHPPASPVFPVWMRISLRTSQLPCTFFSITRTSLNFRRALFNPPLIPFTLSFTSLRAPRRRKRCLCSNYSRLWSDWATPPPTTTPQETATQGFFFFSVSSVSRVFNPEPQKVNGRDVSSLWLLFVSPSSLLSRSIHLSLSPLFPPPVSYVCIPHSCGNKTKKKGPRITTRVWRCAAGASRPVQERMKHSSVVIINSCRYCETGTAATVLGELCSPYSCALLTFQPVDVFYCGCHGGVAGTQYD